MKCTPNKSLYFKGEVYCVTVSVLMNSNIHSARVYSAPVGCPVLWDQCFGRVSGRSRLRRAIIVVAFTRLVIALGGSNRCFLLCATLPDLVVASY